ncbi:MAG: hypothetical protein JWL83_1325 [Actinomycetia bacterium]|nr:hypothetical protein [Actinomycetes bacterium]
MRRSIAYLGWHGRGNLGDDAIRSGVAASLPGQQLLDVPLYPSDLLAMSPRMLRRLPSSVPFLGGGTCVGRRNWRVHVRCGLALARGRPASAVGVGVEDPAFSGRNSFSGGGELQRWRSTLRAFDRVTVRGPRSAELLADVGVDAPVVGDPALALERPSRVVEEGRIGVNIGFGDDLWGHDPERVADAVAETCRELAARGHHLVGLAVNEADGPMLERVLGATGQPITIDSPESPEAFAASAQQCSLVVAMRLHASVLAALSGTPTVSLEYQPKCRDFARSIGAEQHLVRTDQVSPSMLLDAALALFEQRASERARLLDAVDVLRARLRAEFAHVSSIVDVPVLSGR